MTGPPLRDGADALRTTRPGVGSARPDGRTACHNGFVTDPDVANGYVTETAARGRARRRPRKPRRNPQPAIRIP